MPLPAGQQKIKNNLVANKILAKGLSRDFGQVRSSEADRWPLTKKWYNHSWLYFILNKTKICNMGRQPFLFFLLFTSKVFRSRDNSSRRFLTGRGGLYRPGLPVLLVTNFFSKWARIRVLSSIQNVTKICFGAWCDKCASWEQQCEKK